MLITMKPNTRKIIAQEYSRLICLPLQWLQWVGLEGGDLIEITIGDNKELIIKPYKEKQNEKKD